MNHLPGCGYSGVDPETGVGACAYGCPVGTGLRREPEVCRIGVKLWLDDVRPAPDETWVVARSVEEARDILSVRFVEIASLDHDMGECDECAAVFPPRGYPLVTDTCRHKMTGYDFVMWMAETGKWPASKPAVHSVNPVGRQRMEAVIARYYVRPGGAA